MRCLIMIALTTLSVTSKAQRIEPLPTNNVSGLELASQLYQTGGCGRSPVSGARKTGTLYIIDDHACANVNVQIALPKKQHEKPLLNLIPNTLQLTRTEIAVMPTTSIRDIVSLAPRTYQVRRGGDVQMTGSRGTDVLYVIDGMQIPRN